MTLHNKQVLLSTKIVSASMNQTALRHICLYLSIPVLRRGINF